MSDEETEGKNKMSRNFIVLDTETAPTVAYADGNAHPETSRVYDLGYVVSDRKGNVVEKRSFIIAETFFNASLMNSAYYADKLPQYNAGIGKECKPVSFLEAWRTFKQDIKEFGVKDVWAFNARFDETSLNATMRAFSNGFQGFFVPFKCNMRDIWDFAGSTICNTKKYVKWCFENGKTTAKGNPSTNAETVYSYLTKQTDFKERHTAADDAGIELEILLACFKRKQKARQTCGQGWRDAYKIAKNM